jgi:hypothetical protein
VGSPLGYLIEFIKEGVKKMKKNYETPEILLAEVKENDAIKTSGGDTPYLFAFDW